MVCAMCLLLTVFMPLAEAAQPRALVCPEGHNGTMIITRYTEWEPAESEKRYFDGAWWIKYRYTRRMYMQCTAVSSHTEYLDQYKSSDWQFFGY